MGWSSKYSFSPRLCTIQFDDSQHMTPCLGSTREICGFQKRGENVRVIHIRTWGMIKTKLIEIDELCNLQFRCCYIFTPQLWKWRTCFCFKRSNISIRADLSFSTEAWHDVYSNQLINLAKMGPLNQLFLGLNGSGVTWSIVDQKPPTNQYFHTDLIYLSIILTANILSKFLTRCITKQISKQNLHIGFIFIPNISPMFVPMWMFPKIVGFPPKSSIFNRVFHDFHHPFWGTTIFGNTYVSP